MAVKNYRELVVWQKAVELVEQVYQVTRQFPKEEMYGLTNQVRRAAVSIPSNIAEGYGRKSKKEYLQFYSIAYGSLLELETQLILSHDLKFISDNDFEVTDSTREEVSKMLYTMIAKLKS